MKALIVASSREELKPFNDQRCIKVASGVGLVLAAVETVRAIVEYCPDIVISVGSAGAMNPSYDIGDVLSFSSVSNADHDLSSFHLPRFSTLNKDGSTLGSISLSSVGGALLSSSSFASRRVDGYDASDMEGYAVALAASSFNIRAAAFKLITDIVGEKPYIADYRRILREGRMKLESEVMSYINSL